MANRNISSKDMDTSLRQKVTDDYDAVAADWDRTRQSAWGEFVFLEALLGSQPHILDAGCGNGRLITWLDEKLGAQHYAYLGVDGSAGLLEHAKKNFPEQDFQQADLTGFQNERKYNLIACIAVLHHLPSREDRLAVLQNLHKSLAEGGQLFLTAWNLWQPRYFKYVLKSYLTGTPRDCRIPFQNKVDRFVHACTASEILDLAEEAGFSSIDVFPTDGDKKTSWWRARNIVMIAQK